MKWMVLRFLPILLILSLLLGACAAPPVVAVVPIPVVPTAIVVPSMTAVASATNVPPVSDDVWNRITTNKKIVIGVSWDYPPFAYVDSNFQVVGFDIALSREIGKRLNIPVDIKNFTFDGLPEALQLNQVDLAIAAIANTPERASQMSFSPIYYVNQTAVLARSDSTIQITDFNQLAGYKVGVRRGGVFESMVQDRLVKPGLMSSDKLLSYMQADDAVRDLVAKRVDLVLIGQATAKYYNTQQGLQIVGKNFGQQDQAVAMRALWDEFEARETPEARFAAALDRLQPIMHNYATGGVAWRDHGVKAAQVRARNRHMEEGAAPLWAFASAMIEDAIRRGWLPE